MIKDITIGIITVVLIIITLNAVQDVEDILITGRHLKGARVVVNISPDAIWKDLPSFIREDMAKGWSGNKLNKDDLKEICNWYKHKIETYKEPISIHGGFEKNGKLKKEE